MQVTPQNAEPGFSADEYSRIYGLALEVSKLRLDNGTLDSKRSDLDEVLKEAVMMTVDSSGTVHLVYPNDPMSYAKMIQMVIEQYHLAIYTLTFLKDDFLPMLTRLKEGVTPCANDLVLIQSIRKPNAYEGSTRYIENENVLSGFVKGGDAFKTKWEQFLNDLEAAITEKLPQSLEKMKPNDQSPSP